MLIYIVIIIAIISVLLAVISYKRLGKRPEEEKVKEDLRKGKIIFQDQTRNH